MPSDLTFPQKSHPKAPRDGDKRQARQRVRYLVKTGRLLNPHTLLCVLCGRPATEYDHYLGYDAAHHETVQPVCRPCNTRVGFARGERPIPNGKRQRNRRLDRQRRLLRASPRQPSHDLP